MKPDCQSCQQSMQGHPTCAAGGVFRVGRKLGACAQHGINNRCFYNGECKHKLEPISRPWFDEAWVLECEGRN